MKIGTYRYSLTPTNEFYLIGYGPSFESRKHPAQGVHDDIYANVLLIEIEKQYIFIFNADFIEFEESFCNKMKTKLNEQFNINPNHVLFSATHNHQSIMSYHKTWKSGVFDPQYYDELQISIVKSYQQCLNNLVEVEAYFNSKIIEGYYGNRNYPDQLADNEVIVVEFIDETKKVIAGIVNWAVHSTVISPENNLLTSELAGAVCTKLFEYKNYYPLMIVGAAGDCSNRNFRQGNDYQELKRVSEGLAKAIAQIEVNQKINIKQLKSMRITHRVAYNMQDQVAEIRRRIVEAEAELKTSVNFDRIKILNSTIDGLKRRLTINEIDLELSSSIVNAGDLQIISSPAELGSAFGIKIKADSPSLCTLIFGYTNGHMHYVMPQEEYGKFFETINSYYPKGEPEKYVGKIIEAAKRIEEGETV